MPTKNPRINVTFEESIASVLADLAKQEGKSMSCLVKELILEALERREDMELAAIAQARDTKNVKTISHEEAWK